MVNKSKDSLGDRMKAYEGQYSGQQLMDLVPIVARMDGRAFHTFTAGLMRPFDRRLSDLMVETTSYLVKETGAKIGYTQSDEISLLWYNDDLESQVFFDAKMLKMASILASMTTAYFNKNLARFLPEKADRMPMFDSRVYNIPTDWEASNYLIWRELDCTRNSISMAAQSMFSHSQLQGKSGSEMQEMMFQVYGVNWNDYPSSFKRGNYIQRRKTERPFTTTELASLPPKHEAHKNPSLAIVRQDVFRVELPPLRKIKNREAVIFEGATPIMKDLETTQEE